MMRYARALCVLSLAAVASCSTSGSSHLPQISQTNLSNNVLQFAVGTANIAQDSAVGVNVVATLRQPNGLSGTLVNTPSISGPAGFSVPPGSSGAGGPGNVDAGTSRVSASAQVPVNQMPANTTLGMFNGVFAYGIGPFNTDQSGLAYFAGNPAPSFSASAYHNISVIASAAMVLDPTQPQPFFSADPFDYLGGPPAYPFFLDGVSEPPAFAGFGQGFSTFETAPAAGTYTMNVGVNPSNAPAVSYTASASIANTTPLAALAKPAVTSASAGALAGTVTVPNDARITETMVYVVVVHNGSLRFYSAGPIPGTGAHTFTIPATLGPCAGIGCQNGASATATLTTGDMYFVAAASFDYPAFEASTSTSQTPTIAGAGGQADISTSPINGPLTY